MVSEIPSVAGEAQLLRDFAAGDDAAALELYDRYSGATFSLGLRALGGRELASQAVVLTFASALRLSSSFRGETGLSAWFFGLACQAAESVWRHEEQRTGSSLRPRTPDGVIPGSTPEQAWESWEIRQALEALPSEEREVLRLVYLDGLTHTETARRLGVSPGTISTRSHHAHSSLGELLSRSGRDGIRGENRERYG